MTVPARRSAPTNARPRLVAHRARRLALPATAALLLAGLAGAPARAQDAAEHAAQNETFDRIVLSPTATPDTAATLTWRTPAASAAPVVEYQPADGGPATTVAATPTGQVAGGHYHRADLTGLTPDTAYRYRLGDGAEFSDWITFRTAGAAGAPFSFLYFGDIQNDITTGAAPLVRAAQADVPHAELTLHAGDLINNANADAEWAEWFAAFGTPHTATHPQIATPGNHEYDGWKLSDHWTRQFPGAGNGPDDEDLDGTVYYTDYQGVRFVSLNSNYTNAPWFDVVDWLEDQRVWLDRVLSDNPNRWTVVTLHQPVMANSEGRTGVLVREAFLDVLEEHDVDLVLQGHDHSYGRGNLLDRRTDDPAVTTGPAYVVSVAGPKMYEPTPADWTAAGAEVRVQRGDTQTYQVVDVTADRLRYESRTGDGAVVDAFTVIRDAQGKRVVED
ncbi:purple acid phosphatase family protein [Streptomyces triticirhizae]|uniref:Metallophosphoesterase family protein n=1 Tax=Streptomyces triticirhizae TaxID=2483353 RepID=A0A3M2M4Y6_9ACTN|nr:metallophosphoesterase family protein [Streptomyces triticirhizae]RMI44621.1 metallophosphoesterase family protein [Streptomyces triticirhizae]